MCDIFHALRISKAMGKLMKGEKRMLTNYGKLNAAIDNWRTQVSQRITKGNGQRASQKQLCERIIDL